MSLSSIKDVLGKSLGAAVFVVMALLCGVVPVAAETPSAGGTGQEENGAPVACGTLFLFMPLPDSEVDLCPPLDDDDLRMAWVDQMVQALEAYGTAHGTYRVPDSGFDGGGNGWALYEGNRYATSIAARLSAEGFFPPLETSNHWDSTTALAASEGIAMVYRCKDRVAVFNVHSSAQASGDSSDWWTENRCNPYPIDQLGASYFVVSRSLGHLEGADEREDLRVAAVDATLEALRSYAVANGTYLVPGTGFDGRGSGWAFYEGSRYSTSIANALIATGHLSADPLHDPLWADTTSMASAEGAVLVYACKDRVAVFARHGTAQPATTEADWWAENECTRYPIDQLGATYYRVSNSLSCGCISQGHFFFS